MSPAIARRSRLSRLTDNMGLKLLSLVLSIALFSIVHSDQDGQRSLFVDVVATLPPPDSGYMLVSDLPHQVKVTLRGSKARLSELQRGEVGPIQMDLTDTARRFFYFGPASLDAPGSFQVTEIEPSTVGLEWVKAAEQRVAVDPMIAGELGPGLAVRQPVQVQPGVVTVRGPVDAVAGLTSVRTDIIDVEGMSLGAHGLRVPLQPLPEHMSYLGDVMVEVQLVVQPELSERTFRRLSVASVGEGDASLRPRVVAVTLRGPKGRLEAYDTELLVPFVELSQVAEAGTKPVPVKLRGDLEGIEVLKIVPAEVLVHRRAATAADMAE